MRECCSSVLSATPKLGEMAKVYRYRYTHTHIYILYIHIGYILHFAAQKIHFWREKKSKNHFTLGVQVGHLWSRKPV